MKFYRRCAAVGWVGALIITPGLLDGGASVSIAVVVGVISLALAAWGGYFGGLLWDKPDGKRHDG